ELVGIEVEYADRVAAGDVYPAVVAVRRDVINSPGGRDLRGGKNLVGPGRAVVGRGDVAETQKCREADGSREQCAGASGRFLHRVAPGCQFTVGYPVFPGRTPSEIVYPTSAAGWYPRERPSATIFLPGRSAEGGDRARCRRSGRRWLAGRVERP